MHPYKLIYFCMYKYNITDEHIYMCRYIHIARNTPYMSRVYTISYIQYMHLIKIDFVKCKNLHKNKYSILNQSDVINSDLFVQIYLLLIVNSALLIEDL